MVYRIYVEKKPGLDNEARALLSDARSLLGVKGLENVRLFNRYDAENIDGELFRRAVGSVFSEPQLDFVYDEPELDGAYVFAVEYLPGQFDQRADSAAQCIQIISRGERPDVRSAKLYALYGKISESDISAIKKYVINPVEAREASLEKPETLKTDFTVPSTVKTLEGFTKLDRPALEKFVSDYGLAMDGDDIEFCQKYFISEHRDPTITEIRMIDTYWSDHCRHTTFLTHIDSVEFEDGLLQSAYEDYMNVRAKLGRTKPVCLMDIATIGARYLKAEGKLQKLDESDEINACTVKINVTEDGVETPWLLLFKNETHNHPTEIEPFGGAATCIGGAIRDPLSGRSYVYAAMRVTGAADPTVPVSETLEGKLPQRKIVTTAAAGYSSYGNQIGLATGIVDEIYHPGYAAKRMEIGAVIAATPAENVRRETPAPGDVVILLGGATGRDGIGGATGSSKSHNAHSVEECGAEVQKGNAPEERKLQRLFRNRQACRMIKRCNDFGAGGVSVAIGELADGLDIDLDAVPKKYEGLDGTELAISESQERMAVVVSNDDVAPFLSLAKKENLRACPVATVTEDPRLVMRWNGVRIVDVSRQFLNSNGAEKHVKIAPAKPEPFECEISGGFAENYVKTVSDLNVCSKRGLSERFDSTIGAGTVLMPFGGKYQQTPIQAMAQKISCEKTHTDDCSVMSWAYDPQIAEKSPYHAAYIAVAESVGKLIATGADLNDTYLTFQEYFEKPGTSGKRWGKPLAALLGAFEAQKDLGIAAIGGKDSMSGSFESLDVPPTLVSFAVTVDKTKNIVSPEFKEAGHKVFMLAPDFDKNGLPEKDSVLALYNRVTRLLREGKAVSCYITGTGGIGEAVFKQAIGNRIGFEFDSALSVSDIFKRRVCTFLLETTEDVDGTLIGVTTEKECIVYGDEELPLTDLQKAYEDRLEGVYVCNIKDADTPLENFSFERESNRSAAVKCAKPKVLIPTFPGTNCEYDSAKAMADAGADPEIIVINNMSSDGISASIEEFAEKLYGAQMIFVPGGFSGGDEPDGSGKFITAFFRNEAVKTAVHELLDRRDGLICGICNGFQALIKLGLVPYGRILDQTEETSPTLTFNTIARHQSRIVRVRVASNVSPWLSRTKVGDIYSVPISHGEGRFFADPALVRKLAENGQIATQYVDLSGNASSDVHFNPNGSVYAVEGITSPDGRVFGKMGHSERKGSGLYKNVIGQYDMQMFESAVDYFK